MFNIWVDYPSFEEEISIVKNTTTDKQVTLRPILTGEEIMYFQNLIRRIPVPDAVYDYAVKLVSKTRMNNPLTHDLTKKYLEKNRAKHFSKTGTCFYSERFHCKNLFGRVYGRC